MTDFYFLIEGYHKNKEFKNGVICLIGLFFFGCLTTLYTVSSSLFFCLITTTEQHTATAFIIYPVPSASHTDPWDCNKIAKGISFILNAYGTNVEIERVVNRKIHTQRKHAWYNKTLL